MKLLKTLLGFIIAIPIVPFIVATVCYQNDVWPWELIFGWRGK